MASHLEYLQWARTHKMAEQDQLSYKTVFHVAYQRAAHPTLPATIVQRDCADYAIDVTAFDSPRFLESVFELDLYSNLARMIPQTVRRRQSVMAVLQAGIGKKMRENDLGKDQLCHRSKKT